MNAITMAAKAVLCAAITMGSAAVAGCSSDSRPSDAASVGTVQIPLSTTVGTTTYRLEAVFTITGAQGSIVLTTQGDESALTASLPVGAYTLVITSFTLFKQDSSGAFHAVHASAVLTTQAFNIVANSTTSFTLHFVTDGTTVALQTGTVNFNIAVTEAGCTPIAVDATARTVQSARFFLDFSNGVPGNPEELNVLRWAGGENLVESFASDVCTANVVEFFGNSWAPPDPNMGGLVLVGSGSTGSWVQDGDSIVIDSVSSGCSASAAIPVETRYRFRKGIGADTIEVERQFDLDGVSLNRSFRPFMPRVSSAFNQVLHPNAAGTSLVSEDVFACPYGCELSDWDGSWFAYYASSGPYAGRGMIVRRAPSAVPVKLWIDNDAGITNTNTSGVLFVPPTGGYPQELSEKELFCFFDSGTWTPAQRAALTLPQGCTLDLECNAGGGGPHSNPPPHIDNLQIDPGTTITTCETATFTVSATAPDGEAITYSWPQYGPTRAPIVANDNQAVFGPALAGDYTLQVRVSDPEGNANYVGVTMHVTLDDACPPVVPDLATIPQLYCAGTCGNWGGGDGCQQEDADALCRLRTGDPNATAQSFTIATALPEPGVCCSPYPMRINGCVDIGAQPGIPFSVGVISWSLLDSHGPGSVVTDVVCQP
jgi:hypothetical protein